MTDEPYRWLEAIANRREYIRDQLKGATPVFAFSRPEGILLVGVGAGQSKVFEIYDRHALAALGHPVDIEKIRQAVIEAAHMEGFTRASEDVTVRRLLNFSLSPALKTSYEQIFAAPLLVECVLTELGDTPGEDVLARVSFDGSHRLQRAGLVVVHTDAANEAAAAARLREQLSPETPLREVVRLALATWRVLTEGKTFAPPPASAPEEAAKLSIEDKVLELALLDRRATGRVRYRPLDPASLAS